VEGEVLAFDDAFEHEVWNNSTRTRVVLVVDLWHPNLLAKEQFDAMNVVTEEESCDASVT
jgi:aspartyl/asparaginyl beta-hydroxylase (cupin superfamily)